MPFLTGQIKEIGDTLLSVAGKAFTFQAFITGGIVDAVPGIVLQLILKLINLFSERRN